ncbi:MAG TPA: S8 family peptidase [Fimbriimonadaceae bacterium]|nr:S8 family peptidase [Fimbriimonadaceae bacterium]
MNRALLTIAALLGVAAAHAQVGGGYSEGQVVVKFKDRVSSTALQAANRAIGAEAVEENSDLGFTLIELPDTMSVDRAVRYYRSLPSVEYAEPNYTYHAFLTPNDSGWNNQYGPRKMACPTAWDVTTGSASVVIAIVDTGIALTHPDLNDKIVAGYDFVNNDSNATDDQGHGTHCAGIAAAETNNATGVAGVGFNCKLMPVKVLGSNGSGSLTNVANGITFAANNGAKVISLSLGGSSGSTTLQNAVNYAWGRGCVVVAAAGNNGNTAPSYPGYYTNAIAVGSTDANDNRSSFSNYGNWVDVAAPGSSIYSTLRSGGYGNMSGTSMACPGVAGLAGLVFAKQGASATATSVRAAIENNCDNVGTWVVKGRVNAFRAVSAGGGGGGGGGGGTTAALSNLTVNPSTVIGGNNSTGTVFLTAAAPVGGFAVTLSSSNTAVARCGSSVTVAQGQTSANFTINTSLVSAQGTATFRATAGAVTKSANLVVNPEGGSVTLASVSLNPTSVFAFYTSTLSVRLTSAAPGGGMTINLVSANPAVASVPGSIFVPAGQISAMVNVSTGWVTADTAVAITGSHGVITRSTNLLVKKW